MGEINLASQVNLTYLNRFKADIIIMYEMTMWNRSLVACSDESVPLSFTELYSKFQLTDQLSGHNFYSSGPLSLLS